MNTEITLTANYPQDFILLLNPLEKDSYDGDYSTYIKDFYSEEKLFPIAKFITDNLYSVLTKPEVKEQNYYWGYDVIFYLKRALLEGSHYKYAAEIYDRYVLKYWEWMLEVEDPNELDRYEIFKLVIETIAQYKSGIALEETLLKAWNRIPKGNLEYVFIFPIDSHGLFDEEEKSKFQLQDGKRNTIDYDLPNEPDPIELYLHVIKSLSKKISDKDLIEHAMACLMLMYDNVTYINSEQNGRYLLFLEKLRAIIGTEKVPTVVYDLFNYFMDAYIKYPEDPHTPLKMTKSQKNDFNLRFNAFFEWCIETENYEVLRKIWDNVAYIVDNNFEVTKNAVMNLLKLDSEVISRINESHRSLSIPMDSLFDKKDYQLIVDLYQNGCIKRPENFYFEIAYSFAQLKNYTAAKRLYMTAIESGKASNAICNNLGVIYSTQENNDKEALIWYKKAVELDPSDQTAKNNMKNVEKRLQEEKDRPKMLTELYFKNTKRFHKSLLFAIYKLSHQALTIEVLATATKQKPEYVDKNLSHLMKLGFISNKDGRLIIDPVIEKLVADFVDAKLERQIIQADQTNLSRPIFFHESEISLYQVLLELFPQHFVFPNISLKTIVDTEKLREAISSEQLSYLFMAHVDFAIISTTSYMPVLAIEKDSSYHDNDSALKKDEMKNSILKVSGIPLVRIRFNKAMTADKLKQEIRNVTKDLIISMQKNDLKDHKLLGEIDIRSFGVSEHSDIDLDTLYGIWSNIVGEGISKKSKVKDFINSSELHVSVSSELETIMSFSQEQITMKLTEAIPQMEQLVISYY